MMLDWTQIGPAVLGGALLAGTAVYLWARTVVRRAAAAATEVAARAAAAEREEALADAKRQAALAAREELVQAREALEQEGSRRRREVERRESAVERRQSELEERGARVDRDAGKVAAREQDLERRASAVEQRERETQERLQRVAGLTAEEARREVLQRVEDQARADAAALQRDIKEQARREADREARRIISIAIQRLAAEQTAESTVATVSLPSDDLKGRIIGREGRNIRAFEAATGVDVIIDDTPDTVVVSCFDPVRKEIGRLALERLIADGRIHPGRIEEIVGKAREEVEAGVVEAGEAAAYETGIHGLHPELIRLIGRMRYRSSYGQNILQHSKEVAWLAGMMAGELKLDTHLAKRGGLLHDIGKVLTHEHEGTHVQLGVEVATKYGEHPTVINAIAAHHDDVPHESAISVIVQAADAVSGSRPGARREAFETYVKRLTQLEELAAGFAGVERVFAIQAGREVRVVVSPNAIDDGRAAELSEQIARKIEQELQYPGQIRVVVIRETRAVGFAR